MKVKVSSLDNKTGEEISLNKAIFGADVREDILHRVVRWQLAKRHSAQHNTKIKAELNGTTKKPFKQKGTGNARQGDRKGPHMRGGYAAHGPSSSRNYTLSLPKKVRALGLKSALSHKAKEGKLHVFTDAKLKEAKTKDLNTKLDKLKLSSALIIDSNVDGNLKLAASNLHTINVLAADGANVYDILRHDDLVITVDALKQLEARLA